MNDELSERDADRLTLLDRLAARLPELDLNQTDVEWVTLEDGLEGLAVNGGGLDGGKGATFALGPGDDVHAIGSTAPLIEGHVGCVVIRPDGSRYLARTVADPLAE